MLREPQRALELGYPVPGLPAGNVTNDVSSRHPGAVSVDDGVAGGTEKLLRDVLGNGPADFPTGELRVPTTGNRKNMGEGFPGPCRMPLSHVFFRAPSLSYQPLWLHVYIVL